jgi:hypothetical protein
VVLEFCGRCELKGGFSSRSGYIWDDLKHMGTVSRESLALHILQISKLFLDIWFRSCVASYVWGGNVKLMVVKQCV